MAATRKPRADGVEARARILDSAEALFAQRGFFGTSVRDITEHAAVRLASVNYHFVSKEILFRDVLVRRADALNRDRCALLDEVGSHGSKQRRTRALVQAFVAPAALRASESQGWRNYLALVAQVGNSRLEVLALVADHFNPTAQRFIAGLGDIYVGCPPRALQHGFQFMLACTLYAFSGNARIDVLSRGAYRSDDVRGTAEELIEFVTAALAHTCGKAKPRK